MQSNFNLKTQTGAGVGNEVPEKPRLAETVARGLSREP